jgi:hypothetical protein
VEVTRIVNRLHEHWKEASLFLPETEWNIHAKIFLRPFCGECERVSF